MAGSTDSIFVAVSHGARLVLETFSSEHEHDPTVFLLHLDSPNQGIYVGGET
jgi:hypothetical protein